MKDGARWYRERSPSRPRRPVHNRPRIIHHPVIVEFSGESDPAIARPKSKQPLGLTSRARLGDDGKSLRRYLLRASRCTL